jgi:hypothetical protein
MVNAMDALRKVQDFMTKKEKVADGMQIVFYSSLSSVDMSG